MVCSKAQNFTLEGSEQVVSTSSRAFVVAMGKGQDVWPEMAEETHLLGDILAAQKLDQVTSPGAPSMCEAAACC